LSAGFRICYKETAIRVVSDIWLSTKTARMNYADCCSYIDAVVFEHLCFSQHKALQKH